MSGLFLSHRFQPHPRPQSALQETGQWNEDSLTQSHGVTTEMLEAFRALQRLDFDACNYTAIAPIDPWGRLACGILTGKATHQDIMELHPQPTLTQQAWLLHWALFVYFRARKFPTDDFWSLFSAEASQQAISLVAPHLLRYVTAALLLTRRGMRTWTNLVSETEYRDGIVEFGVRLCMEYDLEAAREQLSECDCWKDFFLEKHNLEEQARVFLMEQYCRVHNKIDFATLGESEQWMVHLIRQSDLDAHIEDGCVVMGGKPQSIYEQVMEKTRDLNIRSAMLVQNLNTTLGDARKEKAKKERELMEE